MASVRIRPEDTAEVARLSEHFAEFFEPSVPVLMLRWNGRAVDITRGVDGQVLLEQFAPAAWAVQFGGWVNTPDRNVADIALKVEGQFAMLDYHASAAVGCFVIGVSGGELTVHLEEA